MKEYYPTDTTDTTDTAPRDVLKILVGTPDEVESAINVIIASGAKITMHPSSHLIPLAPEIISSSRGVINAMVICCVFVLVTQK